VVYLRRYADSGSLDIGHRLADLNTTVGLVKGKLVVAWRKCWKKKKERMVFGKWETSMFGGILDWKVQLRDHQIENKPASGSVEELPVCRAQV
jgi:hypothetical protein